jgi:cellulose synthase/poly-beta-1,6-N-acetylglucosamine synthase-like glycosyltransferase
MSSRLEKENAASGDSFVDVLMITHKRPEYVKRSLPALLASADPYTRVWLWHNGDDEDTLAVVKQYWDHPAVHMIHHSKTNAGIRTPTNWAWLQSDGDFVSKVDDDCIVSPDWIQQLRSAHVGEPNVGVVGTWRFYQEDFDAEAAMTKVQRLNNGIRVLRNHWVQGSGYLAKRAVVQQLGGIKEGESFPDWCLRASSSGFKNGWVYPFVWEEHMDDPRSKHTIFRDEASFVEHRPLHAKLTGIHTLEAWTAEQHNEGLAVQRAPIYIYDYYKPFTKFRKKIMLLAREPKQTITKISARLGLIRSRWWTV